MELPGDLEQLLIERGGGEGFIGQGSYLRLWPAEELAEQHETLDAALNWPGLLLIGTDGANKLFAWDQRASRYVAVDKIGDDDRRVLGRSWNECLSTLAGWYRRTRQSGSGGM